MLDSTPSVRFETDLLTLVFTLLDQEIIKLSLHWRCQKTTTTTTTSIIVLNLEIIISTRGQLHRATETFLVASSGDEVSVGLPEISLIWTFTLR